MSNYISSMRGELFYVISNHSCLDNLKGYESHCKIEITFYWFSLHQWYCRALKLPVHTLSVDFSLVLLSAFEFCIVFIQLFLCFSTLHWGRAQLLCLMLLQNILKYFVVFFFFPSVSYSAGLHRLFSAGILILFPTVSNTVFVTNGGGRTCLMEL